MEDNLIELFCVVDDFCKVFYPKWEAKLIQDGIKRRCRYTQLHPSEIISIILYFQIKRFRDFKTYYLGYVQLHLRSYFPRLVSYKRITALFKSALVPLACFLKTLQGEKTGIYFADATILKVCHIKREKRHRVFRGLAKKAKSSMGWFFGFKLHLVINDRGELMAAQFTSGNVDDRRPIEDLTQHLVGKLFADKGYISRDLTESLLNHGLQLITPIRRTMKNKLMPIVDKILLRKRSIIETVNDQLKNTYQIEHTRHRSVWNFMVNALGALIAYALQSKKPSLNLNIIKPLCLTS